MQIDALAVLLRPRSMNEATDLGVRMVQAHARSIWGCFIPVYALVLALAVATVDLATWAPFLVLFLAKPWLDRSLLFALSRAVFGETTTFADLWQQQRKVWWRRLLPDLLLQRLSASRAFTAPVEQLEGPGSAATLRARRKVLLGGQQGSARLLLFVFSMVETMLWVGALAAVAWLTPKGFELDMADLFARNRSTLAAAVMALSYGAVVLVVEPYYVAAGFAMYLNRRVQLEAWDVEQEFRRVFA